MYSASAVASRASKKARLAPWPRVACDLLPMRLLLLATTARGGVENFLARAVVLLDAQDARAGKILGKAQDVADIGAAPAVDGLVFVADDAEIGIFAGQQPQQVVLHAVGVLIFVHVNVAEALLPGGARVVETAQHLDGAQQQIVEIERAGLAQNVLVGRINARAVMRERSSIGVGERLRRA